MTKRQFKIAGVLLLVWMLLVYLDLWRLGSDKFKEGECAIFSGEEFLGNQIKIIKVGQTNYLYKTECAVTDSWGCLGELDKDVMDETYQKIDCHGKFEK